MSDTTGLPNILFVITDQHRADHVGFAHSDKSRGAPVAVT